MHIPRPWTTSALFAPSVLALFACSDVSGTTKASDRRGITDPAVYQEQPDTSFAVYSLSVTNTDCVPGQVQTKSLTIPGTATPGVAQNFCLLTRLRGNLGYNKAPMSDYVSESYDADGVRTVTVGAARCDDVIDIDISCWPCSNFSNGCPISIREVEAGTVGVGTDSVDAAEPFTSPGFIDQIHGAFLAAQTTGMDGDLARVAIAGANDLESYTHSVTSGLGMGATYYTWAPTDGGPVANTVDYATYTSASCPGMSGGLGCDYCWVSNSAPFCQPLDPPGKSLNGQKMACGLIGVTGPWLGSNAQLAVYHEPSEMPLLIASASSGQTTPGGAMGCVEF